MNMYGKYSQPGLVDTTWANRDRIRAFGAWFAIGMAVLTICVTAIWYAAERSTQSRIVSNTTYRLRSSVEDLQKRLTGYVDQLSILVRSPALARYVEARKEIDARDLESTFLNYATTDSHIAQIRYLDTDGIERIRVDGKAGRATVIPRDQLQDKSNRYYFKQSCNLAPGNIYVSPLDLNIENGRIETPWDPMLRIAAPVFDRSGHHAGILILNLRGDELLAALAPRRDEAVTIELLNGDGYWLYGVPVEKLWGFMFGRAITARKEQPILWSRFSQAERGSFWMGQDFYSFDTLHPAQLFRGHTATAVPSGESWKIVSHSFHSRATALQSPRNWALLALAVGTITWGSWLWSGLIQYRRAATRNAAMLAQLIQSANKIIVIKDADGRYVKVNRKFEESFGFCEADVLRKRAHDILPQEVADYIAARDAAVLAANGPIESEETWPHLDGSHSHLVLRFPLHSSNDESPLVACLATDITSLKSTEMQLVYARQRADDANRAKSAFLASMSHELRTPLNAIIGFSELLHDGLAGSLTEKQHRFVEDIFESGRHLLSIINDVLDLSKVEAGKMDLEIEDYVVNDLLSASMAFVREAAASRNIALDLRIAPLAGLHTADVRKVKQILLNLLSNAVKFTPDGGKVTVSARRIATADVPDCGAVLSVATEFLEISVEDTGIGIAENDLPALFTPFHQVDNALSRQFKGTGLGLSLVKRLAELHGGTVGVSSTRGEGSTFRVFLPYGLPCGKAYLGGALSHADTTPKPASSGMRVLVIEDDSKATELLRLHLEGIGFSVSLAKSIEEARKQLADSPFELITLDILLPEADGWQFLEWLKSTDAYRSIPVLVISIVADRTKGLSLGAAEVLSKPLNGASLHVTLSQLGFDGTMPALRSQSSDDKQGAA